jgi:hypothetical protein
MADLEEIVALEVLGRQLAERNALSREDSNALRRIIKCKIFDLECKFNPVFGAMFRSGSSHLTLFAYQVQRYSDLYAQDVLCLWSYPLDHFFFTAPPRQMPHEPPLPGFRL